ncbi:MAG TPA: hypothetical protein VFQ53_14385 [Kofleriaceae bacterium]|nr:hypothetical protein [Kofleriaceae bacterium]
MGCSATEKKIDEDFAFDGTCVNCHAGLSAGHVHTNYKLRCVDCHGGNDQVVEVPKEAFKNETDFRNQVNLRKSHVLPDPKIARLLFANGVDDDEDGQIDEPPLFDAGKTQLLDPGERFEPGLHGEGAGEFVDTELSRDLNYTRFLNPGDLRVASISCGKGSRAAFDGGGGGACHQQTIDIVRRSIMVNQAAVTNGAYYGNESWRSDFVMGRAPNCIDPILCNNPDMGDDPRFGAFSYALDYDGPDGCITPPANAATDPRAQPAFDRECLKTRAAAEDAAVAAGAPGNVGLDAFEIAQGTIKPAPGVEQGFSLAQVGAGDTRIPWGGKPITGDAHAQLGPLRNGEVLPGIPDPVDNILRTFRAYYPLNYPGSTNNFNFTFGTSILPEIARFRTGNPYGRGHSSGCAACHAIYNYEGNRNPTKVRNDDGTITEVVDPTTKHREFDPANDRGPVLGIDRLIGRPVNAQEVADSGPVAQRPQGNVGEQEKTYSANHNVTTKIDTDQCGLCHGFVTRINYAYQGMAEEEQRDALARRAPIEFTTPNGTQVRILDSWVREDNDINNDGVKDAQPTVVIPDGVDIVNRARERDAKLEKDFGLKPGFGGCVPAVFTEDCNNNGELDTNLVLEKKDVDGNVLATTTINEDLNGNGKLDLIDRLPREKAIDGRQVRYIYGGRNGSTRQMDVHFERGMHCIDCHFIQDVHGDGNVYSTNWDAIEIECEDCHGARAKTNFLTSGPNGGNDMRLARNEDLEPFFEDRDGVVIQRSRVTTGLAWRVPQTIDQNGNPYAREAHGEQHIGNPKEGSTFAGQQGSSALVSAKVECASCHNGFITNCVGCHVDINVGDPQRLKVEPDLSTISRSAGENEVWMSNAHNAGHINFQLLGLLRAPFVLGVGSTTEQGRLSTLRSSMQVHVSVTDATGNTIRDNLTFTTWQLFDGNSGRSNVATSGVAMNQTMAHTVRPNEARGCETCHTLFDNAGNSRNDHLLAQTMGVGTGSLAYLGDWVFAAGSNGIELFEYKKERELANNLIVGASQRFPGFIVNPNDRITAKVEPVFDGTAGINAGAQTNDVLLIRNYNPTPAVGGTLPPTLRDLAVMGVDAGGLGRLVISDVSARGNPGSARQGLANQNVHEIVNLSGVPRALAHIASDVSDPYVYAAIGTAGVSVIRIDDAPRVGITDAQEIRVANVGGRTATDVALAGDFLFVGTAEGVIVVFDINDPENPVEIGTANVGSAVNDMIVNGFLLYVATQSGLAIMDLQNPNTPTQIGGAVPGTAPALGLAVSEGHAFVATGTGVIEIDAKTPALPQNLGDVAQRVAGQTVNAVDVVVSVLPGQKWIIALESGGTVAGIKLDNTLTRYERCYPDPGTQDCLMELDMYDPTHSGKDPSFDPIAGTFDNPAVDPSAIQFFRETPAILGNGKHLARPVFWEQVGTLSGRRYRDSFMPGSGVLSLEVMQLMRAVGVCELDNPSTNPSGLNELGYFFGPGDCQPFSAASAKIARQRRATCSSKLLGPGIRSLVCERIPQVKTAEQPRTPGLPPVAASLVGAPAAR